MNSVDATAGPCRGEHLGPAVHRLRAAVPAAYVLVMSSERKV